MGYALIAERRKIMTVKEFEAAVKEEVGKLYEMYMSTGCGKDYFFSASVSGGYMRYVLYAAKEPYPSVFEHSKFQEEPDEE
jgi:hypothetical protein